MKRYTEYKDSGVPWIGDIPRHWEVDKIRKRFVQRNVKVSDKDYAPLSVSKMGVTTQLESAVKTDNGDNRKLVLEGDFVVNSRSDRKGSCGISPQDGSVSLINIVLKPSNVNKYYSHYLLRSNDYVEEFYRNGRGIVADLWTTRYQEMKSIMIPIPTPAEQEKVVSFLDKQTDLIERCICLRERELQTLIELKQAKIASAVTRGLNPDVPMKDSGIPWIGMIPAHWEINRNKVFLREKKSIVGSRTDFPLLSLTKEGVILRDVESGKGKFPKDFESYKIVEPEDIIFCLFDVDETPRTVGLSSLSGMITGAYTIFEIHGIDKRFFYYTYLSIDDRKGLRPLYSGLRKVVNVDKFLSAKMPVPPIDEQRQIVEYIDSQTRVIGEYITSLEKEIEYLKEYKQRLISDVVTGKVDVRDEA